MYDKQMLSRIAIPNDLASTRKTGKGVYLFPGRFY
jgi:hypothetical protein